MTQLSSFLGIARVVLLALLALPASTGMAAAQFDVSRDRSFFEDGAFDLPYDNGVKPFTVPITTDDGLTLIEGINHTPLPGIFDYGAMPDSLKGKITVEDFETLMRRLFENRPIEAPGIGPIVVTPSGTAGGGYVLRALGAPAYQTGQWQTDAPAQPPLVVDKSVIGLVNSGAIGVGFRIELTGQPRVLTMAAGEVRTFECAGECVGAKVSFNRSGSGTETGQDIALGKLYRFRRGPEGWSLSE